MNKCSTIWIPEEEENTIKAMCEPIELPSTKDTEGLIKFPTEKKVEGVAFACGGKYVIDEEWIKVNELDNPGIKPFCAVCNKELFVGDYADGYFPYHAENNICKECEGERE